MPFPQISQFSPPLAFLCASGEFERGACAGEPFYKEYEGRGYCVLHYPGTNKTADFEKALRKKLGAREFNFEGVRFPEKVFFCKYHFTETVSFRAAVFMDESDFTDANFNKANFTAAVFLNRAVFSGTTFNHTAGFNRAVFEADAHFHKAHFEGKATFINTEFKANFDFQHSEFSRRADFYHATFHGNAGFRDVTFKDDARFARDKETQLLAKFMDLQHTRIEKPERILFHTLALLPQWFVNVNTRKFEFINVEWYEDVDQKPNKKLRATSADPLLAICYRNLAVNAEENHRYDEASTFRYLAMDTRRRVRAARRREKFRVFPFLTLEWWYWVASGYGERILRALSGLIAVWLLFTVCYWNTPFAQRNGVARSDQEQVMQSSEQVLPLDLGDACIYSLAVMTLQKQEARPVYKTTRLLVLIETVLGPLQAALLALAIRRKFIR